jgi:Fic family protein
VHGGVLHRPLLYLSHFFKCHRAEYYDRLMAVRIDEDWEGWLSFFLRGVTETSDDAMRTASAILALREANQRLVHELGAKGIRLLESLYERPLVTVTAAAAHLQVSWPTASKLVKAFEDRGILEEITGHRRNRVFRYVPYLRLFRDQAPD